MYVYKGRRLTPEDRRRQKRRADLIGAAVMLALVAAGAAIGLAVGVLL